MVRVPSYDNFQVSPNVQNTPELTGAISQEQATIGARQIKAAGDAGMQMANAQSRIALDMSEEANNVRVTDAVNKMRQRALDLSYSPEDGYMNLKGGAALTRPDGKALPDEYGDKLTETSSEIMASLGNDAQRRAFQQRAVDLETNFRGDVQRHMLSEFNTFHNSVADGNFKLSVQEAEMNWNNPEKITNAIDGTQDPVTGQHFGGLKQSIYDKARLNGLSAEQTEVAMLDAESQVHSTVIKTALANNNAEYANGYFNKYKGRMTADAILTVQGQVDQRMDTAVSMGAVATTTQRYSQNFEPNDMGRLTNIVLGMESGNKRYGGAGSVAGPNDLTTSPKGAKGEMQVLDSTNLDPGFGVRPAENDTPEERARVGQDYLSAMVKRYGNAGQALAAYNAGPGRVDEAIQQAKAAGNENAWTQFLPSETQKYVQAGMQKFGTGGGAPPLPTELEFVNAAVTSLGDNPRPEALRITRETATKQYSLLKEARTQRADDALGRAQQELISNGGNFDLLAPETLTDLSRYDPVKYTEAKAFAKSVSQSDKATNPEAYATAALHPAELAAMPEPVFMQFLMANFSTADQQKITKLRTDQMNGTSDDSAQSINNEALNFTVSNRLANLGINPSPKKEDGSDEMQRVGNIQKFIRDDIYDQQKQLGRKMNPKEVEERVDLLFGKNMTLKGLFGKYQGNLVTMTYDDIPSDARVKLRAEYRQRGIRSPTEEQLLEAYKRRAKNNA